jgi:hypothetical protein
MATMKVTLWDVDIVYTGVNPATDSETPIHTKVGVVEGDWQDGMEDTSIDMSVFYWFDDPSEVVVGATMCEDKIVAIDGDPYTQEEEYEI